MKIPQDLKYTKDHEWARLESGDIVVVGITDYAQEQLSDIVYVSLPQVGTQVKKGEPFGSIEAVKAVADLYSPVTGEVIEVNEKIVNETFKINQDPYGEGWLIKVKPRDLSELDTLMNAQEYEKYLKEVG